MCPLEQWFSREEKGVAGAEGETRGGGKLQLLKPLKRSEDFPCDSP